MEVVGPANSPAFQRVNGAASQMGDGVNRGFGDDHASVPLKSDAHSVAKRRNYDARFTTGATASNLSSLSVSRLK